MDLGKRATFGKIDFVRFKLLETRSTATIETRQILNGNVLKKANPASEKMFKNF